MSGLLSKLGDSLNDSQSEDRIMNEFIQSIQREQPKIDGATKNLLAVLMSKKPPSTIIVNTTEQEEDYLPPMKAMECAKVFLKTVQSFPLLNIDEFCVKYPQAPTQSANDRLDEICKYKAFYALREHALSKGIKLSKTFGRSYFIHTKQWESLRKAVIDNISSIISLEELEIFLKTFEKSIFSTASIEGDQDLIWSKDFNAALRSRQVARTKAVTQRIEEANAAATSELSQIVEAVRGEERVEVLDEEEEDSA